MFTARIFVYIFIYIIRMTDLFVFTWRRSASRALPFLFPSHHLTERVLCTQINLSPLCFRGNRATYSQILGASSRRQTVVCPDACNDRCFSVSVCVSPRHHLHKSAFIFAKVYGEILYYQRAKGLHVCRIYSKPFGCTPASTFIAG